MNAFLKKYGRSIIIGIPMVWLIIFFLLPFVVVFKISFADIARARPPYTPLFSWEEGRLLIALSFENYAYLWEDTLYIKAYWSSMVIAFWSTVFALILGYPMAYVIARAPDRNRNLLLMLVILPFWTSFLLRVYAWIGFLKTQGVINAILLKIGIISEPLIMLQTDFAVYVGIVYTYLPFMILPLYANLTKLDDTLLEAAHDLGASKLMSFLTISLPLSIPGIIAGCMLVFIPAIGEFVIPALLGGPDTLMIGKILWTEFFNNRDWPVASAVATAMLILLVIPIMWMRRAAEEQVS